MLKLQALGKDQNLKELWRLGLANANLFKSYVLQKPYYWSFCLEIFSKEAEISDLPIKTSALNLSNAFNSKLEDEESHMTLKMWALGKDQNLKESQRSGLANAIFLLNRPAPDKTSRFKEDSRIESAILQSDA